jgi:hypothetical protein
MAAPRRVIEITIGEDAMARLETIARSRTEPACRVERARILLAYRDDPSTYVVGEAIGVTHQTVQRCLRRALQLGVMEALDDSPRPGKVAEITEDTKAWLVSLACRKATELGSPRDLDDAAAGTPRPRACGGCRTPLPVEHRARHSLQDPCAPRVEAAQGSLLSRTARRRVRREDG